MLAAVTVQVYVKDMTFENKEGVQQGLVNIFGRVTTLTGRIVQTFEDVVRVDVPASQLERYLNQKRRLLAGAAAAARLVPAGSGVEGHSQRQRGN